jgi:hypothetical protein
MHLGMVLLPGVCICPYVCGSGVTTLDGTNVFGYPCLVYIYHGIQIACAHYTCAQYVHVVCAYVYLVGGIRCVYVWVGPKDPLGNATQHCVGAYLHCREGEMV